MNKKLHVKFAHALKSNVMKSLLHFSLVLNYFTHIKFSYHIIEKSQNLIQFLHISAIEGNGIPARNKQ